MVKRIVYVLSRDVNWLRTAEALGDDRIEVRPVLHTGDCTAPGLLPAPNPTSMVVLDALGQPELARAIRHLRATGWRNVIVVASVTSEKDARAAIQAGAYDYLAKQYELPLLRSDLEQCLMGIERNTNFVPERTPEDAHRCEGPEPPVNSRRGQRPG